MRFVRNDRAYATPDRTLVALVRTRNYVPAGALNRMNRGYGTAGKQCTAVNNNNTYRLCAGGAWTVKVYAVVVLVNGLEARPCFWSHCSDHGVRLCVN